MPALSGEPEPIESIPLHEYLARWSSAPAAQILESLAQTVVHFVNLEENVSHILQSQLPELLDAHATQEQSEASLKDALSLRSQGIASYLLLGRYSSVMFGMAQHDTTARLDLEDAEEVAVWGELRTVIGRYGHTDAAYTELYAASLKSMTARAEFRHGVKMTLPNDVDIHSDTIQAIEYGDSNFGLQGIGAVNRFNESGNTPLPNHRLYVAPRAFLR